MNHLDNFRFAYTINWSGEPFSTPEAELNGPFDGMILSTLKILMWAPVISQIAAIILFVGVCKDKDMKKSTACALISRGVIGFFATPLLIPIDIVGTLVKIVINARESILLAK